MPPDLPPDFGVCWPFDLSPVAGVFPAFFAGCGVAVWPPFLPSVTNPAINILA